MPILLFAPVKPPAAKSDKEGKPPPKKEVKEPGGLGKIQADIHKALEKVGAAPPVKLVCTSTGRSVNAIVFGGAATAVWLLLQFTRLAQFSSLLCAYVYPAYATLQSIQLKKDEHTWMSYWIIFGFLAVIENFETPLLMFVPAYYFIKGVLCLWLYSPETQGANLIRQVVSKLVLKPAKEKEKEPPKTEPKNEEKRGIIRASSARWGMRA